MHYMCTDLIILDKINKKFTLFNLINYFMYFLLLLVQGLLVIFEAFV